MKLCSLGDHGIGEWGRHSRTGGGKWTRADHRRTDRPASLATARVYGGISSRMESLTPNGIKDMCKMQGRVQIVVDE